MVEKKMIEKMEREMENLQADHLRESQDLVRQFNEAQEILKDKISELQIMYVCRTIIDFFFFFT